MHELGLCEAIVDAVERQAAGRPVRRVTVRVGRLLHVHPDAFELSFALAAAGGVAEGAVAELVMAPARGRCGRCGHESCSDDEDLADLPPFVCERCGSTDLQLTGGDELVLETMEFRCRQPAE